MTKHESLFPTILKKKIRQKKTGFSNIINELKISKRTSSQKEKKRKPTSEKTTRSSKRKGNDLRSSGNLTNHYTKEKRTSGLWALLKILGEMLKASFF